MTARIVAVVRGTPCRPRVTVRGHLTFESGVRPARSRASEVTTLNVDPGGFWPTVASDWPLVAELFAADQNRPGRRADRHERAAGLVLARVFSASFCSSDLQRRGQRLAGHRFDLEDGHRLRRGARARRRTARARRARRSSWSATSCTWTPGVPRSWAVVPLLQPGQPDLVAADHRAVRGVDDLLGRVADHPDHRTGEVAVRRQHQIVLDRGAAGNCPDVSGEWQVLVRRSQHDRLDEGLLAGRRRRAWRTRRRRSSPVGPGVGPRTSTCAGLIAALSMPIRKTARLTTIGLPPSPRSRPRSGRRRRCDSRFAAVELRLQDGGLPVGLPAPGIGRQSSLGLVGPLLTDPGNAQVTVRSAVAPLSCRVDASRPRPPAAADPSRRPAAGTTH